MRGWCSALGSVATEVSAPRSCLELVCEGSRSEASAVGVAPVAAANLSTARWPVFLDDMALTSVWFSGAAMAGAGAEAPPRFLQIDDADAIPFPVAAVRLHFQVKVGAT